jgi:hypothetical protein
MNNTVVPEDPSSEEYKNVLAQLLERLNPYTPKGTKLCDAFMQNWTSVAFEGAAFSRTKDGVKVYLRKRAPDETAYPDQWHVPGKIYRVGEHDHHVANRLEEEFGTKIENFDFIGRKIISYESRGTVHSMIFWVELAGEPRLDDHHGWFLINDLPQVTVVHHKNVIIPAAYSAGMGRLKSRH